MTWLDIFTPAHEIRPARPAPKNFAGRGKTVETVAMSSTSSMSSTKKDIEKNPEAIAPAESFHDAPTAAQLAHARCMLVDCPSTGGKLHCWYCSRCGDARTCSAWGSRRGDVEFFRRSETPYSLYLVEGVEAGEVVQ